MARSKTFLRTRDIDWAVELGGRYIHVSSAGGDLPAIVEDRLFEIWRELKDADIVCEEEDVELNEKYLSEKFPVEAEGNNVVRNISRRGRGTGTCPKPKNQRFTCLFPHLSLQREDGNNSSINENVDLSLVA